MCRTLPSDESIMSASNERSSATPSSMFDAPVMDEWPPLSTANDAFSWLKARTAAAASVFVLGMIRQCGLRSIWLDAQYACSRALYAVSLGKRTISPRTAWRRRHCVAGLFTVCALKLMPWVKMCCPMFSGWMAASEMTMQVSCEIHIPRAISNFILHFDGEV